MRTPVVAVLCLAGLLTLPPVSDASAQDVPCDAYKDDAWRSTFWGLGRHYAIDPGEGEKPVPSFADALALFDGGRRDAAIALLSQAAATTDIQGRPPLQAMVASYMLHILRACSALVPGR